MKCSYEKQNSVTPKNHFGHLTPSWEILRQNTFGGKKNFQGPETSISEITSTASMMAYC